MPDRRPELGQIEFESIDAPAGDAPDVLAGESSSSKLPALIVALVVGGLLTALVWVSSDSGSTASPDEPIDQSLAEEAEAESDDEAAGEPDEELDADEQESVIPESSAASIALEPVRLPSEFSEVVLVNGQFFATREVTSVADGRESPLISRSVDGETWEDLETRAIESGTESAVQYFWDFFRASGDVLAMSAYDTASDIERPFISADGVEWELVPEPEDFDGSSLFFLPLAVTDDYTVAVSTAGSDILGQFVEDHTTAVDVDDACFADFTAVISCDFETEWLVNEGTIDSEVDSDAVLECFEVLSFLGPELLLSRFGTGDSELETFALKINPLQFLPLLISDGRIVGFDDQSFADEQAVCDGLAAIEPVEPAAVWVFDPRNSTVERAELEPSFFPPATQVLGNVPIPGSDLFLFRFGAQLWTLDLDTGEWATVGENLPGDTVLSDSGQRVYSFSGRDMHIIDIELVDGEVTMEETIVYVAMPPAFSFSGLRAATDDSLIFETQGQLWLLDVPSGVTCAEQFAEALAGNGLVEDC